MQCHQQGLQRKILDIPYLIDTHFQSLWVGSAQPLEHGGGATRAGVVADVPPGGGAKCATHEAGTLLHTIGCHRYVDIT